MQPFTSLCLRLCSQMWAENQAHHYWLHLKFAMTKLLSLTWPTTLTSNHTTFLLAIHSPSRRWRFKPTHSPPLPLLSYTASGPASCFAGTLHTIGRESCSLAPSHLHASVSSSQGEGAVSCSEAGLLPGHWVCLLCATQIAYSSNSPLSSPFSCIISITILQFFPS